MIHLGRDAWTLSDGLSACCFMGSLVLALVD